MNIPAELKFKNEDERIAMIEQYETDGGSDVNELNRIAEAPVEVPDPIDPEEVVEDIEEPEVPEAPETPETPEAPAQPAATPAEQKRSWTVTENDIPKDMYFDKKEGKQRPFITQNNFQDLTKSYISGQKRIHYLEDILLPQEREAAKLEVQAEVDRLKAEVERLKSSPPAPAAQTPAAPAQPLAPSTPSSAGTPVPIADAAKGLAAALEELRAVDPKDAIDHTDKLHQALMASLTHANSLTDHINRVQESTTQVGTRFEKLEEDRRTEAQRAAQEAKASQAQSNWRNACQLMDSFAQTSPEFKEEFGQIDQSFEKMSNDAMDFHISLAGLMFNKHPNQATKQEVEAATQAYLSGNEQLKTRAAQYGLDEPRNYRAWMELDQVDAMRTGLYRDPVSKQWVQQTDPVTKSPVMLGDPNTAYGRYLDVTGKRNQRTQALLKKQQESLTGAIARRDTGIVSMDTNKLSSDGSGADMTEDQALQIAESMDGTSEMSDYLRTGNRQQLDLLNRALARLGGQPIEIPDLGDARPKPAGQ